MNKTVVIAGAGPAGLTAALELLRRDAGHVPIVVEADSQVGGISKTVNYRGNRMDLGGHRFFSKSDWVMNWWQDILPVSGTDEELSNIELAYHGQSRRFSATGAEADAELVMLVRPRLSRIYYRREFFDYPLKLNANTLRKLGWFEAVRLGVSYGAAKLKPRRPERTLEDFFVNRFGSRLYRTFFKDYTEKVWGVSCSAISAEWGAQRVKGLSVTTALLHALKSAIGNGAGLSQKGVETSLIERFLYPRLGPGQMWEEVARHVRIGGGSIYLRHRVIALETCNNAVRRVQVHDLSTDEFRWIACDAFISTMPIRELVQQLRPAEAHVNEVAAGLPYRDFMTAGLVVRRMKSRADGHESIPQDNWIYIQEPDVKIGRLQIFNNWSPDLVATPGTVSLGLEYFCNEGDDLWTMPDDRFLEFAAAELEKIGLIDHCDVLDGTVVRVPKAYPAYFGAYAQIGAVREFLDGFENLYAIGRNGMHRYNNQDHSMLAAKAAVDCLVSGSNDKASIWSVNTEEDYHEARSN
jgi:protoporphyrinogen oxidase